ncbi:MAG: rRNA pseudouridine synthase [Betaproteobacteria bacterium]|nr:rRNA pseudouridine synthase [Betaproteobacteria bacterium]
MSVPVRLAKRLAELLRCSRREAEQYIEGGWVRVDGQVVEEPQFRVLEQRIDLDPGARLAPVEAITVLLHQSPGDDAGAAAPPPSVTAATHAADDHSGIRVLKRHFSKLMPTAPLQAGASGLLVLTQDWRIARALRDDGANVEQEYVVEVSGNLTPDQLRLLNHGLSFNDRALPAIKVSWQNETRLRFALKDIRPGQIAQMCGQVGLTVLAMKRLRIGRVPMAGLQSGQWRYLPAGARF